MAAGAGATAGRGDVGARFEQCLGVARAGRLQVHLVGGGRHDQPGARVDLSALQDPCRDREVFESRVGAGAQEGLVDGPAAHLGDRLHVAGVVRTGNLRLQVRELDGVHRFVIRIRIGGEGLHFRVDAFAQVAACDLVRLEEGELGPQLHPHVRHRHSARDRHGARRGAGVLDGAIAGDLRSEPARQMQHDVFRHHARRELTLEHEADRRRNPEPELAGLQDVRHLGEPDAAARRTDRTVGRAVGVRPEDQVSREHVTALGQDLMADAGVPEEVRDLEPLRELPRDLVPARHLLVRRREVVIEDDHDLLGIEDAVDSESQQVQGTDREGLMGHHAVDPRGDVLPRAHAIRSRRAREDLLGHGHRHRPGFYRKRAARGA